VEDAAPIVYWVERIAREADADAQVREQLRGRPEGDVPVLVTGAAGALGSEIVERLQAAGEEVRVFVRRRAASEMPKGVQTAIGDLGDPAAVDDAVRGARVVIHAGAATRGGWAEQRTGTVVGTENIIEACLRYGVEQLIYISSLSVVDWAGARSGEPITEASPLEPHAEWRGAYTRAKLEAENLVRRAVAQRGLRAVILRPGQIYGAQLPIVNAAVARRLGKAHVVLGDGALRLPLVHIDDVVDAICLAMEKRLTGGQVIQLVDSELPTQNELLAQTFGSQTRTVRIPRWFVYAAGALSELAFGALKRQSPFSRYRLRSALARRTYVSLNATPLLGWVPRRRASSRTVVETVPQQT
jgi:nucleoside-diphosphate-sugar epimerase